MATQRKSTGTRRPARHRDAITLLKADHQQLLAEIEQLTPSDDYFIAKVNVLGEMIKHHVREEEKPSGMFAEARKARMDLVALGARLADRKSQLETQQQAA